MVAESYIIRGGVEGFDRLKVLSRILHPATCALFDRVGIAKGMRCLDVGCGSGDVTFELARRVGVAGRVLGVDLDEVKLALAQRQAAAEELRQVELRVADVTTLSERPEYDVIYARLLLTHLRDPAAAVSQLRSLLRPGGALIVEDIDLSSGFLYPSSRAFERYCQLYIATAQCRGADPLIGPRLYSLLQVAGFAQLHVDLSQPVGAVGDIKLIAPLTMKSIAPAVLEDGRASHAEITQLMQDLEATVNDATSIVGLPQIFQVWGRVN